MSELITVIFLDTKGNPVSLIGDNFKATPFIPSDDKIAQHVYPEISRPYLSIKSSGESELAPNVPFKDYAAAMSKRSSTENIVDLRPKQNEHAQLNAARLTP